MLAGENRGIERSDQITLKAKIQPGFGEFEGSVYRPVIIAVNEPDPPDYSAKMRDVFATRLRALFRQSPAADLALGFLMGEKTLPAELASQLKIVGLSHIVVASGYSLSILLNFAKKHLLKISRFAGYASAALLAILFLTVTGLSPSLLRAGLVSGMSLLAEYFGRKFHPGRLLIYVVAISIFVKPTIITNIAWQLSFASYAGIILFVPLLTTYFYGRGHPSSLAEMIIVSFSAQLACLPISIYSFGYFSVISILANILITPIIPVIMALSFLIGILPAAMIAPLAALDNCLLGYQIFTIQNLSQINWATMEIGAGHPAVFLAYIPIVAAMMLVKRSARYSFRPTYALDNSLEYGKIYSC